MLNTPELLRLFRNKVLMLELSQFSLDDYIFEFNELQYHIGVVDNRTLHIEKKNDDDDDDDDDEDDEDELSSWLAIAYSRFKLAAVQDDSDSPFDQGGFYST